MATSNLPPKNGQAPPRPSHTLYCTNLPDKLQKDDLKQALYMLFSTYGAILDIVAQKTMKMRGQAHVLFRDTQASTQAMRALQGYEFFGKQMKISYAVTKSDTLAKLDGTYKQPDSTAGQTQAASTQPSIFSGPPGTTTAASNPSHASRSLAPPATVGASRAASPAAATTGDKRLREESDDDEEAPMDMDDEAMDESDDE